jgi:HIRAN domain
MPQYPIVGAHFHPPAKAMLSLMPAGASLWLERQPDNQYDSNAVAVFCAPDAVPSHAHGHLAILIAGHGMELAEYLSAESYHLGFIPRTEAEHVAPKLDALLCSQTAMFGFEAELCFLADGKPAVRWEWPIEDES